MNTGWLDIGKVRGNSRGGALVTVLSIAIILNVVLVALYFTVNSTTKKSGVRKSKASALNIAEAGKENLYADIRSGIYNPAAGTLAYRYTGQPFEGGSYTVSCSTNMTRDTMWARSAGVLQTSTTTLATVSRMSNAISIAFPPVRGAITARSSIVIKGNIRIDGRDYDSTAVKVGDGMWGISTCGTFLLANIDGSSSVAGNGLDSLGKKASEADLATVVEDSVPVTGVFASPEAFLGLPAGSLDSYKVASLTTPFQALMYVAADDVGPVHFGQSRGILIVHNAAGTAQLQISDGTFKGLIITDRMDKIDGNASVIGAVVTLATGEVSTFGTGNAEIRYSAQVLANLAKYCQNLRKTVTEISWREVQN